MNPTKHPSCGTYAGLQRHNREGEKSCGPCAAATRTYKQAWRIKMGHAKSVRIRVSTLRALTNISPQTRELLTAELGPRVVTAIVAKTQPKES